MRLAYVVLPASPRHDCPTEAVIAGVRGNGDDAWVGYAGVWDRARYRDCAAIVWTPRARNAAVIAGQRALGAKTIVMENGYLADAAGVPHFSWGFDGYNGSGDHRNADSPPDRWRRLGLPAQPWRKAGRHIVILAQRGMGPPEFGHDAGWPERVVAELRTHTDRPLVLRPHPGARFRPFLPGVRIAADEPLEASLAGAWAAVTYKSTAALTALRLGVPVFATAPCMASPLSLSDVSRIETPAMPDRERFFFDLAYAQWNEAEIARGEPWRWLMDRAP